MGSYFPPNIRKTVANIHPAISKLSVASSLSLRQQLFSCHWGVTLALLLEQQQLAAVGAEEEGAVLQVLLLLHEKHDVAQVNSLSPCPYRHAAAGPTAAGPASSTGPARPLRVLVKFELFTFGPDGRQGGGIRL